MSGKTSGKVWDLLLTPAKQIVLLAYADHADHADGSIKAGVPLVAWKTGYSERQIQRISRELEADGILVPVQTLLGKPTEYRIDFSKGTLKPPYVPRKKHATPDKMSPPNPRQDVTPWGDKMSPPENAGGVTSHGKDDPQGGDIASRDLSSIPLKEEPLKDKSIAPTGALSNANSAADDTPSVSEPEALEDTAPAQADPYADWIPLDQFPDESPSAAYPCTRDDINALIAAWWDWVPVRPTKRGKEIASRAHFGNTTNREFAQTLTERGASPADMIGLLADIRNSVHGTDNDRSPWAYLRERELTFCYVGEILLDWIPADRAETWYTEDCPRITPRKPGYTLRLGEISQGVDIINRFADDPNVILDVPKPWLAAPSSEPVDDPDMWESSYSADDATLLTELAEQGMTL